MNKNPDLKDIAAVLTESCEEFAQAMRGLGGKIILAFRRSSLPLHHIPRRKHNGRLRKRTQRFW